MVHSYFSVMRTKGENESAEGIKIERERATGGGGGGGGCEEEGIIMRIRMKRDNEEDEEEEAIIFKLFRREEKKKKEKRKKKGKENGIMRQLIIIQRTTKTGAKERQIKHSLLGDAPLYAFQNILRPILCFSERTSKTGRVRRGSGWACGNRR